jgi:hypothetical protein
MGLSVQISGYIKELEYDETVHTSFTDLKRAIIHLGNKYCTTLSLNLVTHLASYAN